MHHPDGTGPDRSGPAHRPKNMAAIGAAILVAAIAGAWGYSHHAHEATQPRTQAQQMGAGAPAGAEHLADFGSDQPSPDAKLMANWVLSTHDNHGHAFILVDKKNARVYVFTPEGRLEQSTPALMGAARGDDLLPGTANLSLAQMKPEDKRTPAGRFEAEPGVNADNEDVIWVDYDASISMHRVRPTVASEQRLERLATLSTDDNRITFGCINLPHTFYEDVAKPTVDKYGAVIYVLPEVKTVQQEFGAYDVTDPEQVAQAQQQRTQVAGAARTGAQG